MINEMRTAKIDEGINLHLIKSDKFKTDLIGVYIKRPLKESEVSKNALIARILNQGTRTYETSLELNKKLDELYGSILVIDVHKYGEKQVYQFKLQIPDKKYVSNEKILEQGIDLLNHVINDTFVEKDNFKESFIAKEKENLKARIDGLKDDKVSYAMHKCIESMCANEAFRIHSKGTIELVEQMEEENLLQHYKSVLETSPIDVFVIGDINFDYVTQVINDKINFKRDKIIEIPREETSKKITSVTEVEEHLPIKQSKLTLGYRTNTPYESDLYEASVLLTMILGGGSNSRLFRKIREQESLCYYVFTKLEKFKSIMLITLGISKENKDKVLEIIRKEIKQIHDGGVSEKDLEFAKKSIVSSLQSRSDHPNSFINYCYTSFLTESDVRIDELIEKYQSITTDDIVKASQFLELDTIHFITPKGEE